MINFRIPTGFRSFIYCTAIREGGDKEWNFAVNRYLKESGDTERTNLLTGLSCTKQSWLVDKFLNNLIDANMTRSIDVVSGLRQAAIRPDAILKTWIFVKANWNELFSRFLIISYCTEE